MSLDIFRTPSNPSSALRSRHITPTLDDMILDLNGAKVFSKCDLKMDIIS
jgi:hypothetical protein